MAAPWMRTLLAISLFVNIFSITSCFQRTSKHYTVDLDAPASERWNRVVDDFRDEVYLAAKVLKFGCTSIVAQSGSGQIWHGRNLDYGSNPMERQILSNITIQVDFQRNGTTLYSGSSYAGYVGLPNGQRHKAFTVSMDERDDGNIIENLYMLLDGAIPIPMLIRQVLGRPLNYRQALKNLANTRVSAAAYLIVGGIQTEEGAVITRDRKNAVDIWEIDLKSNRWFVLETNYDHWKPPPASDDRRTPGNKAMNAAGAKGFDGSSMFKVLSTPPVLNNETTFTAIMSAVDPNAFHTYVR
ncbi:N-acylethanolamine-hydrolyzing acid amidase-like isoform X2 [Tubulanus polymorphus]|uniref:N-acylethanolamine-hydrolyzing acid amidase-like isoform X2 n=1 Tax=Tubulanus polymorphus TaxID=672921 RepID=UPI003DA40A22